MRVMVVGASRDPAKFGHKAVRAYLRQHHAVFPVNPAGGSIAGVRAYASIADVPGPIDRATVYLHPADARLAVEQLAARGDVGELWLNPGSESDEVVERARELGFDPILACSIVDIGETP